MGVTALTIFEKQFNKNEMEVLTKINVAASSTEGHFVEGAKQVINLDEVTIRAFSEGCFRIDNEKSHNAENAGGLFDHLSNSV